MKSYELTALFSVRENQYKTCKEALEEELKKQGIETENCEDMGQRQLAYPIKKEESGHYHCYTLKAEKKLVEPLRASLMLLPGLLRFLIIDTDSQNG